jgi:hypothetical protein
MSRPKRIGAKIRLINISRYVVEASAEPVGSRQQAYQGWNWRDG